MDSAHQWVHHKILLFSQNIEKFLDVGVVSDDGRGKLAIADCMAKLLLEMVILGIESQLQLVSEEFDNQIVGDGVLEGFSAGALALLSHIICLIISLTISNSQPFKFILNLVRQPC